METRVTLRLERGEPPGLFLCENEATAEVFVQYVLHGTPAYHAKVVPNAVITRVDKRRVTSVADFHALLRAGVSRRGHDFSLKMILPSLQYPKALLTRSVTRVEQGGKTAMTLVVFKSLIALHKNRFDPQVVIPIQEVANVTSVVTGGKVVVVVKPRGCEPGGEYLFSQSDDSQDNPPGDGEDIVTCIAGLLSLLQMGGMQMRRKREVKEESSGSEISSYDVPQVRSVASSSQRTESRSSSASSSLGARKKVKKSASLHTVAPAKNLVDKLIAEAEGGNELVPFAGDLSMVSPHHLPTDFDGVRGLVSKYVFFYAGCGESWKGGGRAEKRLVLMSDVGVYIIHGESGKLVRSFAIAAIAEVLACRATGVLAFRVPREFDALLVLSGSSPLLAVEVLQILSPGLPSRILDNASASSLAQKLFLDKPKHWKMTPDMMMPFTHRPDIVHYPAPPPPAETILQVATTPRHSPVGIDHISPVRGMDVALFERVDGLASQLQNVSEEMLRMRRMGEMERRSEREQGGQALQRRLATLETTVGSVVEMGRGLAQQQRLLADPSLLPDPPPLSPPPPPLSNLSSHRERNTSPVRAHVPPLIGHAATAVTELLESSMHYPRVKPARRELAGSVSRRFM